MNNNNTTELKSDLSFLELIDDNKILIPVIQRDYAQGRIDAKTTEIRNNFLSAIIDNITSDHVTSLLLDFIYGSTAKDDTFTPLDGQQRLTTLFLLHWYFLPTEKQPILYRKINDSVTSVFSYETRISSKDFCDELVQHSVETLKMEMSNSRNLTIEKINDLNGKIRELSDGSERKEALHGDLDRLKKQLDHNRLSSSLKNQWWFLWSWNNDPTIKAMLVMLDEIDARLGELDENKRQKVWNKLENGSISFHLLPLEKFDLTDELYVKMNARGKELSQFDIFKSSLEEQMRKNHVDENVQNQWRENIDSNWVDLFWNKFAKNTIIEGETTENQKKVVDSVEKGFLIFLKRIIGLYFVENISSYKIDSKDENIARLIPFNDYDGENLKRKLLDQAIQKDIAKLFPLFYKTGFFNESFFKYAIDVFDNLIYKDENSGKHDVSELINLVEISKDNASVFDLFVAEKGDYESFLLFYALINFCLINKTSEILSKEELKLELNSWMRIIRNLSKLSNTFIDDVEDFGTTLKAYQSWCSDVYNCDGNRSIIDYFASHPRKDLPKGRIVNDQFEEEVLKAVLINDEVNGSEWLKEVTELEEHGYFLGQIRSLLNWSKNGDNYDLNKFKFFKKSIIKVFDSNGLKSELCKPETHLFRNCMMANCENYLLLKNDCLVNNTGKDRDRSWKSYLRNKKKSENIKFILEKYNHHNSKTFEKFCSDEIETGKQNIYDWRRCFLNRPSIYNRCSQNQIDYWDKSKMEICLLETSRKWNGLNRHSELNTYYWFLVFNNHKNWIANYCNSQTEQPLTSTFEKDGIVIRVCFKNSDNVNKYILTLNFDPKEAGFSFINNYWIKNFDTINFMNIETFLKNNLT